MISLMMVMTTAPFAMADTEAPDAVTAFETLDEDSYAPGEVIVVFKEDAVKDSRLSLSAARKIEEVDGQFGEMMDATGGSEEAADDAKSEVAIIGESLGDDFVIKDTVAFDDDLKVCLVSSEKYDTETLIRKLSGNDKVKSVEANTYLQPQSTQYSLNDALNQYAYQTNSPADTNKSGKNVSGRGTSPEGALSTRAGAVTDFAADHSSEDEVVVAVIDSGINLDHEDLKNMLWTNPGDIGLEGEHGFNFDDNAELIKDRHGHGTHCSGIIAAQANNGKGVAGTASGINIKIMMCAISGSIIDEEGNFPESDVPTTFNKLGAFNYVLKARQRGVNVVATSNSWGSPDYSRAYDEVMDRLGEEGILSFAAASNEAANLDTVHYAPSGGDSEYMVVVGAADVTGKKAGFSNYGKAGVDLFAPGNGILSTSAHSIYSPSLYPASERAENTEFYGQFSSRTEVGDFDEQLGTNRVVAETEDETGTVNPFGAVKFFKQEAYSAETEDDGETAADPADPADPSPATCQLSVTEEKTFTDNYEPGSDKRPASLKATIKNAREGEEYYLYFPFAKNHLTTGIDNTRYSLITILQHKEDELCASVGGGEVVKYKKDGRIYCACKEAGQIESDPANDDDVKHFYCGGDGGLESSLLSWEDSDPENTDVTETGIGLCIRPSSSTQASSEADTASDEVHDITIYIDSVGLSRPVTEEGKTPEDVFPADSSYEIMSGTSMAAPAAAGAYAVLASLYPKQEGQTGAEYARENRARLFAAVRPTDQLQDFCSTGGYIDLSLINDMDQKSSLTDAVCDTKAETLTLHGENLTKDLKLSYRSLAPGGGEEKPLPSGQVKLSYSDDAKTITISGAKELFGRHLEFILKNGEEICATGSFYTVKGQEKLTEVLKEEHKETLDDTINLPPRYLITDTKGQAVYAYQMNSYDLYEKTAGVLYKYDGSKFVEYPGTKLTDAVFDHYEQELGYDRHQITRGLSVKPLVVRQPIHEGNVIYDFVEAEYTPYNGAEEETIERRTYLCSLNYTDRSPKWTLQEIPSLDEGLSDLEAFNENQLTFCAMKGKIYCFGSTVEEDGAVTEENNFTFAYALDIGTGEWTREKDLEGAVLKKTNAYYNNGEIWLMFGACPEKLSRAVYSFDGNNWKKHADIPFVGRNSTDTIFATGSVAPVKDGFIVFEYSVEGAGNVFLYDAKTGECRPLYYTLGTGLSEPSLVDSGESAVETADGLYFISLHSDAGGIDAYRLYRIPKTSYVYTPRYKSANPMRVTKKNVKAVTVKNAKGKVTYQRVRITCSKKLLKTAKKKILVNKKTGKITLKKGLKKGTYKISIKVTAAGDKIYKAGSKTVTVTVKIK